jgi:hypothetical protein
MYKFFTGIVALLLVCIMLEACGEVSSQKLTVTQEQAVILPAGNYKVKITRHDVSNDFYASDYTGEWNLYLNGEAEYALSHSGTTIYQGNYFQVLDQIVFDSSESRSVYKVAFDGQKLSLSPVDAKNGDLDLGLTLRPLEFTPVSTIWSLSTPQRW